jgi:hypothetical protein
MPRLRKTLVMRAYNLRGEGQTLEDFFKEYSYRKVKTNFSGRLKASFDFFFCHSRMDNC